MKIIDFHVHPIPGETDEKSILKEMEKAKVDMAVLLALDLDPQHLRNKNERRRFLEKCLNLYIWNGLQALKNAEKILETANISNKIVAAMARKYPRKFIAFGSVNPSKDIRYIEEKLREIEKFELKGVKLIPTLQFFNPKNEAAKLNRIFEFCEENGKIIVFHTGCDPAVWEYPEFSENANPKLLEGYIRNFKDVQVVLAHMGSYSRRNPGIWLREAIELGKRYRNLWFDVAAVTYLLTEKGFAETINREIGWEHVLFGSDFPVVKGYSMASAISEIKASPYLSVKEKNMILGLNAMRLLGLD
ncbi:amidohydrolase family protein [Candidatus Bathyarchaeota archaeon]|nr:amidohydrolase family protein [Candidatus Bathyarchaeota archaeon]